MKVSSFTFVTNATPLRLQRTPKASSLQQRTMLVVSTMPTAVIHRRPAPLRVVIAAAGFAAAEPASKTKSVGISTAEEHLPSSRMRLTVTVHTPFIQRMYKRTLEALRKNTPIDGYRKGKAPDAVLIDALGGEERVKNQVLSDMLTPAMDTALAPYASRIIDESEAIEENADTLSSHFNLNSDFVFHIIFDTMPEMKWTKPYKDLTVKVQAAGDEASDAAAVQKRLLELRKERAKLRIVADRGLSKGDVAIIDFAAAIKESNEAIPGAQRSGMQLDTETADTAFMPGVVPILEGMKTGESKTASMTFPSDDTFQPAHLRGVEATVDVTLKELFEYDLPEVGDEWAEDIAPGCGGVSGLMSMLTEAQISETQAATNTRLQQALTAAIAEIIEVDIPESLITDLGTQQYTVELNGLIEKGVMGYEQVEKLAAPELAAKYVERRRPELIALQKSLLGFAEIIKAEGLQATKEEMQQEYNRAVATFNKYDQQWDEDKLREQIQDTIEGAKVLDWLMANANVSIQAYAA